MNTDMAAEDGSRRAWLIGAAALSAGVPWPLQASPAQRIVSVGGGITETLFALGAQGDIVGVDTTSRYPAAAQKLPSVGYQRSLSAEGVLSLRPTLLLATEDAGPLAVLRQIEAAGVRVHLLDSGYRVEGMFTRTQQVADHVGRAEAGQRLVQQLRTEWQATQARVAALAPPDAARRPKVMFLMVQSLHQMRAAGAHTIAHTLIEQAGARNVFAHVEGYKLITPEAVIAAAPEVIITTDHALATVGGAAQLLQGPGLTQTPAGRAARVVALDILLALSFGPRVPLAVRTLAEGLHAPQRTGAFAPVSRERA